MGLLGSIGQKLISFDQSRQPRPQRKALYLICEPGWPNYGDELIAREWLRYISSIDPDLPVILDCNRPGSAAAILYGIHKNLVCVDTIARLTFENEFVKGNHNLESVSEIAFAVRRALDWQGGNPHYASGVKLLEDAIAGVHYLGGGYLNGTWKPNLARLELGRWATDHGIPAIATGLGLMPLSKDDLSYANAAFESFDYVGVRDADTYDALNGVRNLYLDVDDCFVNGLEDCIQIDASELLPEYMVCVQHEFCCDSSLVFDAVDRALKAWGVKPGIDLVGVVECNPIIDRYIYDYLIGRGYSLRFYSTLELLSEGLPVRRDQKWISSRYHPHLVASSFGCSGAFINVDEEYYPIKQNAVLRMGSRWNQISLESIPEAPGFGFEDLDSRDRYRDRIRSSVSDFYKRILDC